METDNVNLEAEGTVIQAARWLASESLHVCAERIEGKSTGWPTLSEALERFGGEARGDDNHVLRVATEMRAQALDALPPLAGQRDPIKESARDTPTHPGMFRNFS